MRYAGLPLLMALFQPTRMLSAQTPAGQTPDILGIRLGMPYDDVTKLARQRHPDGRHVVGEWKYTGAPPIAVKYFYQSSRSGGGETLHVAFAGPPQPSTAIEVMREEAYAKGKELAYQSVLEALTEKYGVPAYIDRTNTDHIWFLDDPAPDAATLEKRAERCKSESSPNGRNLNTYDDDLQPPRMFSASRQSPSMFYHTGCGRILSVTVRYNSYDFSLIQSMTIVLTDHEAGRRAHKLTQQMVMESIDRKKQENTQKPDL